jgi:hypothetical protein
MFVNILRLDEAVILRLYTDLWYNAATLSNFPKT